MMQGKTNLVSMGFSVVIVLFLIRIGDSACPKDRLNLNVVFLNSGQPDSLDFPEAFDEFSLQFHSMPDCVTYRPSNVDVLADLNLPEEGWTKIQTELEFHGTTNKIETHIVVGPYYTNMAMMLEQLNVTYLVTAEKGYDWLDQNKIDDPVTWTTMIELIPSSHDQNTAVVDLFLSNNWINAIMIMPDGVGNEECKDLAHQMIDKKIGLIPFSIADDSKDMIKEVLRNVQLLSQKHIIICSPRDEFDSLIFNVLSEAKKSKMLEKKDLIFMIVEPYSLLQALSGMNNTYELGLFGTQCQLLAFRYIHPQVEMLSRYRSVAADAALVIGEAVEKYLNDSSSQTDHAAFTSLKLLHYMRKVAGPKTSLNGLTGAIKFNERGERKDYTLHLYKHGGVNLFQKIGEWTKSDNQSVPRLSFSEEVISEEPKSDIGIFPSVVKVAVVLDEPFVMKKSGRNGPKFIGFSIELLERLSKDLHFTYTVYEAPNNSYGVLEGGNWTGMVGEVVEKRATFAVGALTMTSDRENSIDFTHGIMNSGSNILIPKPRETLSIFQFLKPFSPALWISILSAFFILCGAFFLLDTNKKTRQFTAKECMWFCLGVLLMRGTDFSPKSTPQRILATGYIFFALITVSTYTANMAAFLTTANWEKSIDSFEDLVNQDTLEPLTISNSSTMSYLSRNERSVIRKLWAKIQATDGIMSSAQEAIKKVSEGKHALVFDYRVNAFAEKTVCETLAVGVPILSLEHGIGLQTGAPYKRLLDIAIIKLRESGFITSLIQKWWNERRKCDNAGKQRSPRDANFEAKHMAGIFIVGIAGLCLSASFFVTKKVYLCFLSTKEHPPSASTAEAEATVFNYSGYQSTT